MSVDTNDLIIVDVLPDFLADRGFMLMVEAPDGLISGALLYLREWFSPLESLNGEQFNTIRVLDDGSGIWWPQGGVTIERSALWGVYVAKMDAMTVKEVVINADAGLPVDEYGGLIAPLDEGTTPVTVPYANGVVFNTATTEGVTVPGDEGGGLGREYVPPTIQRAPRNNNPCPCVRCREGRRDTGERIETTVEERAVLRLLWNYSQVRPSVTSVGDWEAREHGSAEWVPLGDSVGASLTDTRMGEMCGRGLIQRSGTYAYSIDDLGEEVMDYPDVV